MTLNEVEQALTTGPVKPVLWVYVDGKKIFIADGFVEHDMLSLLRRFDIIATPERYPYGCFATICWCFEGKAGMGWTVVNEKFHHFWKSDEAREEIRRKEAIEYVRKELSYLGKTVH